MKKDITPVERKILSSIKQMPGIYIGTKNLLFLEHFIHGYDFAMICHDIKDMHNIMPEGFEEYIEIKYRSNTTKNLFLIITENSENDSDAFDTFFELLDEYLFSVDLQPLPIWDSSGSEFSVVESDDSDGNYDDSRQQFITGFGFKVVIEQTDFSRVRHRKTSLT